MLLKQNQPKLEHQRNNFLRTDQQKQRGKNTLLRIPSLGCIMIGDYWISRTRRTFWDHFFLTSHIFCGCPHVNHTNTHFLPTSHTWILYCPQRSRSEKVNVYSHCLHKSNIQMLSNQSWKFYSSENIPCTSEIIQRLWRIWQRLALVSLAMLLTRLPNSF